MHLVATQARRFRVGGSVPPKRPTPTRDDLASEHRDHAGAQHVEVWAVAEHLDRQLRDRGRVPRRTRHQQLDLIARERDQFAPYRSCQ